MPSAGSEPEIPAAAARPKTWVEGPTGSALLVISHLTHDDELGVYRKKKKSVIFGMLIQEY